MAHYVTGHLTVLESAATHVKINYDTITDTLSLILKENASVTESDEEKPGIILDYDRDGNIVGIEILNASKRMENPRSLEYAVA